MRALCGSIITAGALIGLGLTALGYGIRYQGWTQENPNTHQLYAAPSLLVILIVLLIATLIGLAIAFLGLMYHHQRRYHELQRYYQGTTTPTTTPQAPV